MGKRPDSGHGGRHGHRSNHLHFTGATLGGERYFFAAISARRRSSCSRASGVNSPPPDRCLAPAAL
jgi:hypothetical protein